MSYPLPYAVPMQPAYPPDYLKASEPTLKPPMHPLCASHCCCQTHPEFKAHPALKWIWLAIIFVGLSSLLGFITLFVPWIQKDIAVGTRVMGGLFRTTVEDTFSLINLEQVIDNDFINKNAGAAPLSGGDTLCHNLIIATIAFVFIYWLSGLIVILLMLAVLMKLWSHPSKLAMVILCLLFFVWCCAIISWALWLGYAERTCLANSPYFPVTGYSYGFIMTVFASWFLIIAMFAWFKAFKAIKNFKKGIYLTKLKKGQVIADQAPVPVFPVMLPMAAPSPSSPFTV